MRLCRETETLIILCSDSTRHPALWILHNYRHATTGTVHRGKARLTAIALLTPDATKNRVWGYGCVCSQPSNGRLVINYPLSHWEYDTTKPDRPLRYNPNSSSKKSDGVQAWRTLLIDWSHGPIFVTDLPTPPVMYDALVSSLRLEEAIRLSREQCCEPNGVVCMTCTELVLAAEATEVIGNFAWQPRTHYCYLAPEGPCKIIDFELRASMLWNSAAARDEGSTDPEEREVELQVLGGGFL